jgi:hypothetical protein
MDSLFVGCGRRYGSRVLADAYTMLIFPEAMTGPVGAPVREPPGGSCEIANVAP